MLVFKGKDMTQKAKKRFVVVMAVLLAALFLILSGSRIFKDQIATLARQKSTGTTKTTAIRIDWEELYPYDTTVKLETAPQAGPSEKRLWEQWADKITRRLSKLKNIGQNWSKLLYKYDEISQLGFIVRSRLSDPAIISDTNIRLKNGYWVGTGSSKTRIGFETAVTRIAAYSALSEYLKKCGTDFLFCLAPAKACEIDNELPGGVAFYDNENIDTYIKALDYYGIDRMDFREKIHADGLDHYSLFFITDHHWNVDAGLWAAGTLAEEITGRYGISLESPYDFGPYRRETFKNALFGSAGQNVTHFVAQSEDMDVLFPEFVTDFRLEIPDRGIDATGPFEKLFINYGGIESVMDAGGGYAYEQILYGNRPYVKITNLKNASGPKILMIRDSFAIAVAPYLALSCSELVLLDTRSGNGNFTGSIINCIDQFDPDIVLALEGIPPQAITLNKAS